MTDVKVEQCDVDRAFDSLGLSEAYWLSEAQKHLKARRLSKDFARHRQAAEKATREQDAAYIEGKGGLIPGATVFVSLITGENMPCMSGDARDKLNSHKRRQFDDATRDLATAIRSQNDD